PRILESEGVIDPIDHRNRLIEATAKNWQSSPPDYPVIAAGSTGSMPATATLLSVIARLPQGMVILPGLDKDMPDAEWEMIGDTHPQYGLKRLLEKMNCGRKEVERWEGGNKRRADCLRVILHPPEATSGWRKASPPLAEGMKGVRLLTADTQADEARMIAVMLREVLETPERTAALVTPDRQLARMVAAQMNRFGISIDDSAGIPLKDTPPANFLRLVAQMAAAEAAPVPLLAMLRHPLAALGMDPAHCRRLSREIELKLLRGIRPAAGLDALYNAEHISDEAQIMLRRLAEHASPLMECFRRKTPLPLRDLLTAHAAVAERLAASGTENGAERLWSGETGSQLAGFLAELMAQANLLTQVEPLSYPGLFDTLLSGQTYRPSYGLHPRLHILSPVEARLQRFRLVILGSLNEGMWPSSPQADPWMSRPMRKAFGLPAPERATGQSAHDFAMLCAAPEVVLSRARKVDGAPTVPSRWLVRLETLLKGLQPEQLAAMRVESLYEQGLRLLDQPIESPPPEKPSPTPPLAARPRQLRVTAIDTWLRDPYMIYAQYILRLKKLPPLDEEPDAADFGKLVHSAMEKFVHAWPQALPDQPYEKLLACGRDAFKAFADRPAIACLWWPRFEAMAEWLIEQEKQRRGGLALVAAELQGEWHFTIDGLPFTLTGRIDRMEIGNDGTITIVDYKTGSVPSARDIEGGLANQLPLEALVVMHGKLLNHVSPEGSNIVMEYWKLSGKGDGGEITVMDAATIEASRERLETLIREFDNAATPYAAQSNPSLRPAYNDYEHLTRRQEWEAV
ncbi:MAG: double-strand break repair protein AddB, partial [Pseudomonadota bacterium]|nr:double-strand break repair protein AddB [Pseudomonadota bacterium]